MRHKVEQAGVTSSVSRPVQARLTGPRVLRHLGRIQGRYGWPIVCLISLLGIGLGAGACVTRITERICVYENDPNNPRSLGCEYFANVQVVGTRFEFPTLPNSSPGATPLVLQQSQDFWLKAGDQLQVSFDEYNFLVNKAGAECGPNNPPSNQPQADCAKIWICDHEQSRRDFPGPFPDQRSFDVNPVLIAFEGFMPPYTEIGRLELLSQVGCRTAIRLEGESPQVLQNPFVFTPANSATFMLKNYTQHSGHPTSHDQLNTLAEAKAFVIEPGSMGQPVTYQIKPLAQNVSDATFYSGTVQGSPVLSDNFSPNLHISKVRVLKGQPETDPLTGKLRLKDSSVVHPSRLVFIPDYQGDEVDSHDNNRCYADQSADGDLDLTRCRRAYDVDCNNPMDSTCRLPATPTYLSTEPALLLTWVAEFKESEGGVAPTLEAGEVVAIEFTIEAN